MEFRRLAAYRVAGVGSALALGALGLTAAGVSAAATTSAPTVTSVNPNNGPTAGGTTVTITGTNFKGVQTVDFGTTAATVQSVNRTKTQIVAVSPAESAGTVDVTVTTAKGGTSATSAADQFTYNAPPTTVVSSVTPNTGTTAGGTSVVIAGSNFSNTCTVAFGGVAASSTFVSSTEIDATSPAYFPPGDVPAEVTCGSSSDSKTFTYTQSLGSTWTMLNGAAHDIASGDGHTYVLGVGTAPGGYQPWQWVSGAWSPLGGGLVDIAVNPTNGALVGANNVGQIWEYNGSWTQPTAGSGTARDVAVAPDGTLYVIGTTTAPGGYTLWKWVSGAWVSVPGGATHLALAFSAGNTGDGLWVTNSSNQIWYSAAGDGSDWVQEPGSAVNVGASPDSVWVLGTNTVPGGFGLWGWNGDVAGWEQLTGGGTSVTSGSSTLPAVTNSTNQIWVRS